MRQLQPLFRCERLDHNFYQCIGGCDKKVSAYTRVIDRTIPEGYRELCDECIRDVEYINVSMYHQYRLIDDEYIIYSIDRRHNIWWLDVNDIISGVEKI
jgi:hypothetical protein